MRPYPEEVIKALQSGVMAHLAPEVKSSYGQAQFAFGMLLFGVVQRDYDSAAQDLTDGSAALRALLGDARTALAGVPHPNARAAELALDQLPQPAESLRLSALRAEFEALRQAVVDLVPLIEPAADDAELAPLASVRTAIYAWLRADAQRRVVPILSA